MTWSLHLKYSESSTSLITTFVRFRSSCILKLLVILIISINVFTEDELFKNHHWMDWKYLVNTWIIFKNFFPHLQNKLQNRIKMMPSLVIIFCVNRGRNERLQWCSKSSFTQQEAVALKISPRSFFFFFSKGPKLKWFSVTVYCFVPSLGSIHLKKSYSGLTVPYC